MSESNIQKQIMLDLSAAGATVWRNNTGTAWAGDVQRVMCACMVPVSPGDVVIRNARPLHAGLCKGSSDLIGLFPVRVTSDMVGTLVAQFLAAEVKGPRGRATTEQRNFTEFVASRGGAAGIVRTPAEAIALLKKHAKP